jgi:hypothetical protein
MKRIIRIIIGSSLVIVPCFVASWIWLFTSSDTPENSWYNLVGKFCWYLMSGQWEKLPE